MRPGNTSAVYAGTQFRFQFRQSKSNLIFLAKTLRTNIGTQKESKKQTVLKLQDSLQHFMKSIQTEFVLVKEAASMLGVCPNTIRTWGADGKLAEHRHPINGYRLYKREEIDHLIELMRKPAHPKNPK